MVEEKEDSCMGRKKELTLRIPAVTLTEERVEEIFSVPKTRKLWEEMIDSPKFQKIASISKHLEKATKVAVLQEATKCVINTGEPFDKAVQDRIRFYKSEIY